MVFRFALGTKGGIHVPEGPRAGRTGKILAEKAKGIITLDAEANAM